MAVKEAPVKRTRMSGNSNPYASMERYYRVDIPRRIEEAIEETKWMIKRKIKDIKKRLKWIDNIDENDSHHKANSLQPKKVKRTVAELESYVEKIGAIQVFETKFLKKSPNSLDSLNKRAKQSIKSLLKKAEVCLGDTRMDKGFDRPDLIKIAKETLKKKSYGVNPYERITVNYDLKKRSSKKSYIDGDTITTYFYKWNK